MVIAILVAALFFPSNLKSTSSLKLTEIQVSSDLTKLPIFLLKKSLFCSFLTPEKLGFFLSIFS
jgi:hypothetical protein